MHAEPSAAPRPKITPPSKSPARADLQTIILLFLVAVAAVLVHGYHAFVEDAEIYVPGIKKLLNPALYPYNDIFFASHARLTFFPNLIAGLVRLTHFPLEWVLLTCHLAGIFSLLLACWNLGRLCFGSARAGWGSALLVASLLTIPVAGTALYVMDQYLNTRSFSTAAVVWIMLAAARRKYLHALLWVVITALAHPLMAVFAGVYGALLVWQLPRSFELPRMAPMAPSFQLPEDSVVHGREGAFARDITMVHGPAFDLLVQTPDQVSRRHAPRVVDRFLDLGQEGLDAPL